MRLTNIVRRGLCILALFSSFLVLGAPGGGSGGGGWGGLSGTGIYPTTSGYGDDPLFAGKVPRAQTISAACFVVVLGGFFLWLFYRGRSPFRPATLRITVTVLLEGDAENHAQFFDGILQNNSFALPQERAAALNRVLEYLDTAVIADGFVQERRYSKARTASEMAERFSRRQVQRADADRGPMVIGAPCCVVGFTITATPDQTGSPAPLSDKELALEKCRRLRGITGKSLDFLYLFYSPAPGAVLTRTQGEKMLGDLRKIGGDFPRKAA